MSASITSSNVLQPEVIQPLAVSIGSRTSLDAERVQVASPEHWYAVYTCANHERRVASQLVERSVEHFLPVYSSVRRWKDRRVSLEMPLFPGYVFVRLNLRDKLRVLQIPSVSRLVSFNGQPVPVTDDEIESIQCCLARGGELEPHPYLQAGRRVRVIHGPFADLEGIIIRKKSRFRFVISLHLIMRSVSVEVSEADFVPLI